MFQPVLLSAQYSEISFYTITQVESTQTQAGRAEGCIDCLKGDDTVREIQSLKALTCEEIVRNLQCKDNVDEKYLRDCKAEEALGERVALALGRTVAGCLLGGVVDLSVGAVLGAILAGIIGLIGAPAAGAGAAIGASLYLASEYEKNYKEVEEPDRAKKALFKTLYSIADALRNLFIGDWECYNLLGKSMGGVWFAWWCSRWSGCI